MKAIFGFYYRDGRPASQLVLEKMYTSMHNAKDLDSDLWIAGAVGLGQSRKHQSALERTNYFAQTHSRKNCKFVATARLDNPIEIYRRLNISETESNLLSDCDILKRAYLKWGERCCEYLYGDWSFAAWHPEEERLFLARDHLGSTALYYHIDENIFAFSSSRRSLLALEFIPKELDELYLAQYLTACSAYHGKRTFNTAINHLPPSHHLEVTQKNCTINQYWYLEDTPLLQLPRRADYVDGFKDLFDEAVRCRISSDAPIAATMSGGLDSGSVAVTAANQLKQNNKTLKAFTSIPLHETSIYVGSKRFGNEFPHAKSTANFSGSIDLHPLISVESSPIAILRHLTQFEFEPVHGANNLYWYVDILKAARANGCNVLLTGALGNGGVSWTGDISSQSLSFLFSHLSMRDLSIIMRNGLKQQIKRFLPHEFLIAIQLRRINQRAWCRNSAIHPDFARRIDLLEQILSESGTCLRSPIEKRSRVVKPGRYNGGAFDAQMGALFGLEIRDPTADARLLSFVFSVPDHIFMDPQTGIDRWLIREAMRGRLPDDVRLNRKRGIQSGDLVPRLRACKDEVENVLDELALSAASIYIDVKYMRKVWEVVKLEDTQDAFQKSVTVLTRGIMAGLFVNKFYEQ